MSVLLLRYHVAERDVQTVISAVQSAFAALKKENPDLVRFTYYQVAGTTEFVGLVELRDGVENPLLRLESTKKLKGIVDGLTVGAPPPPQPLKVIGVYEH